MEITQKILNELLYYDKCTGKLYWKFRDKKWFNGDAENTYLTWNSSHADKEAFTCIMPAGHLQGAVFDKNYLAHRIIWFMYYGEWPKFNIDHINGDSSDNRIGNLRDVPQKQNTRNCKLPKNNTSGVQGVYWHKKAKKWAAYIKSDTKIKHLGLFTSLEDAAKVRKETEKEFGYHNNHGRITNV